MANYYLTKEARSYNGVKTVFSINGVGKIGQVHAENETRPPIYTIHKGEHKMNKGLKYK